MKRKLVRVGNSLAVTLPHDLVKEFALRPGMEVDATVDARDGSFVVRSGVRLFEAGEVSPRYRKMVDRLVEERRELYERLGRGKEASPHDRVEPLGGAHILHGRIRSI